MQGGRAEFRQNAVFGGINGGFIINNGSFLGGEGGRTVFYDNAQITGTNVFISNRTETEGSNPGSNGGVTEFLGNSRAGSATIYADGSTSSVAGTRGGRVLFRENSSADNATMRASGGRGEVDAIGGSVEFSGAASAGSSAISAESGFDGGAGGRILFSEGASGGNARVTTDLGGVFDMSALTGPGTTLGSIAGAGDFYLGGKTLTVGSSNSNTVVSGIIHDGGQAGGVSATLNKVGTGTLELSGLNSYTGSTSVNAGTLMITGGLGNGAVSVASGGTLAGTGTIGGDVIVANGGIIAPGKVGAGTLTTGALTLNAGSILNYQLGSLSDRIDVNGPLTLDGTVNVSALSGLTVGVYRLMNYTGAFTNNGLALGTIPAGTTASDFNIQTDVAGQVNLVLNGGLGELLFWDGGNLLANGIVDGGSSSWTNAPSNWTNSGGTLNQPWASQRAVFSGAAGAVTLGENVSTTGLQFVTNGYAVNAPAGTALALTGAAPIRVDAGAVARINAQVTGGALNKTGIGTLVLSADNNYSGGTMVIDGTINVTNPNGLGLGTGPVTVFPTFNSYLDFTGNSSAGSVVITNRGSASTDGGPGWVQFLSSARAGTSTINNLGNSGPEGFGAFINFVDSATAENAVIENAGAAFSPPTLPGYTTAGGGLIYFVGTSSAGAAAITNLPGAGAGYYGGKIEMFGTASAGNATIVNRGGTVAGAYGGTTRLSGSATAANSTLTVEGGANGGLGGTIQFSGLATGGTPRVIFLPGGSADGLLDISATSFAAIGIGSIEGNGMISLGNKRLEVGGNNLETTFSGAISGFGGALRKVGTGMLTLEGPSTYTGGTVVADGILRVSNPNGLGLGNGPVVVQTTASSELRFSFNASAGSVVITNEGGGGAVYGLTTFRSSATAATAVITNNAAPGNGLRGGQTDFYATSTAANATINNLGTFFAGAIGSADLDFFETSTGGAATIGNFGGTVNGGRSGRTLFSSASNAGTASITNFPATAAGAIAGTTIFFNTSTADRATIRNAASSFSGASGGTTEFTASSTAGTAQITVEGSLFSGSLASTLRFSASASADHANIIVQGSGGGTGAAGLMEFLNSATAGAATVRNTRATGSLGGGYTRFSETSRAGSSSITNEGGQLSTGGHGFTEFYDTASAGSATVFNGASLPGGISGARTRFFESASAGAATFDNEGAKTVRANFSDFVESGETNFRNTSSADAATITNRGMTVAGGVSGGIALFLNDSKAGTAMITNEGSALPAVWGPSGGWTRFNNGSSAEQATIINRAALAGVDGGGVTLFNGDLAGNIASADRATITNEGGKFTVGFGGSGRTEFQGNATAGAAIINNKSSEVAAVIGGITIFNTGTNAGSANIHNGGALQSGHLYGLTIFRTGTSAGSATIVNEGGGANTAPGGQTEIRGTATMATATITNRGGTAAGSAGGFTYFAETATAGSSTIRSEGGTVSGAGGGNVTFFGNSTAGQSTLIGTAAVPGAPGGAIVFADSSQGGTARAMLEGDGDRSAGLDISQLATSGMNIGSIEGGGIVSLGSRNLAVGGNNLTSEFSGLIRDGGFVNAVGGSLNKVGTGTLKLSGNNTYTGITTVLAGKLIVSGSLTGAVNVVGGALGGNGTFNGGITVGPGGVVTPGESIGAFSTPGLLSFGTGAAYGLEIDSAAGTADRITAVKVSIGTGVNLYGQEIGAGILPLGFQFKIIDNTSANPTVGTFVGLVEGALFPVANNRFQISYHGGDGNDVTLVQTIPEPSTAGLGCLALLMLFQRRNRQTS